MKSMIGIVGAVLAASSFAAVPAAAASKDGDVTINEDGSRVVCQKAPPKVGSRIATKVCKTVITVGAGASFGAASSGADTLTTSASARHALNSFSFQGLGRGCGR